MQLIVITGTTKGLGESFYKILSEDNNNIIITINRKEINYKNNNINFYFDLSEIDYEKINKFKLLLENILSPRIKNITYINNAFTMGTLSKIDLLNNDEIVSSINTNLVSSIFLIKAFISKTKKFSFKKRILNITSGASKNPIDGWSIYCLGKAAVEMFINSIKVEYNDYECLNIDPGVMKTEMQSNIRKFKNGKSHKYFIELFENRNLKDTDIVAKNIIKEYLK